MTASKRSDKSADKAPRKAQPAKRCDELDAADLDKVTGGMASSRIVKSADPCEGGR